MRKVLRITCIALVIASVFTLTACGNQGKKTDINSLVKTIDISVDKSVVTANKVESVKINAIARDSKGNVVEGASIRYFAVNTQIKMDTLLKKNTQLAYPDFRTDTAGIYKIYATCGNAKSEEKRVIASKGNISSLEISADKVNILSNNTDSVTLILKALGNDGKEIKKAAASFYVDNKPLGDGIFKTDKDGIYLMTSKSGSIISNVIAISAGKKNDNKIQLSVDKALIKNDGQDTATLSAVVSDLNGNKIDNAVVEFADNGVKLDGGTLNSKEEGVHYIYAIYNGQVSNTVKITVRNPTPPKFSGSDTDLPVIVIDTKGKPINEVERINATMYVYNNGKMNKASDVPQLSVPVGIKMRGQSSMTFPKKQYSIETWDENGNDNPVELLGLPKESDWVINGSYADKSLIRNYAAYEFFRPVAKYTPRTRFCEVYINDSDNINSPYNYMGIYTLIEKIKIDPNRLDIDQLTENDNSGVNLTGGYIVAQDKIKEGEPYMEARSKFTYVAPDYIKLTPQQKDYISSYVKAYSDALFGKEYTDPQKGYAAYLDVDSYATMLAVTEFMKSTDGMNLSTYYYKPRGGKLMSGPAWDFDLSAGNTDYRTCTDPKGWYNVRLDIFPRRMMSDPAFVQLFRTKWKELRKTTLSDKHIDEVIDSGISTIKNAKDRSLARWPAQWTGQFVWPNPSGDQYTYTYDDEVNRMRKFLHDRAKWIDENIDKPIDLSQVKYNWINEFTGERMGFYVT